jgi:hypothetical protein
VARRQKFGDSRARHQRRRADEARLRRIAGDHTPRDVTQNGVVVDAEKMQ